MGGYSQLSIRTDPEVYIPGGVDEDAEDDDSDSDEEVEVEVDGENDD
jgi:hypothetical protein